MGSDLLTLILLPMKNVAMKNWLLPMLLFPTLLTAQIVNIEDQRITGTNDSVRWYGQLRLGANLVKVKDQILQINTTARVEYKQERNLVLLLLDGKFLRAGSQDFNNAGFSHLRYNYKLTEVLVWEAYAQAQYNRLLLIRLRALAGNGLRVRLFKDPPGKNRIYAGFAYLYEYNQFLEGNEDRDWHRLSSYLSATFRPGDGVLLVTTTYFQPQVDRFSNFRFSSEWRLALPVGKRLTFTSDFSWSVDRSLPSGAPQSTYSWLNGLTFRL